MSGDPHPLDRLQEAVDGRLAPDARAALDRHLETCPSCRAELEALRWTRAQVATLRDEAVPDGFEALLAEAVADRGAGHAAAPAAGRRWLGALAAAAAVLLAASLWWLLLRPAAPDVVAAAAGDYRRYADGRLSLEVRSADVAAVEAWFRRSRLGFETRVLDLDMMRFAVVGGRVHDLAGREAALYVYRGPGGEPLVCQMYEGRTGELPDPASRHVRNGITFHVYERDGLTLVFWQEGGLVCVLVGAGGTQAVLDLAVAKAMKA
jgi:anti-sigma factor RsiW